MHNNIKSRLMRLVQILSILSSLFIWFIPPSYSAETIYFDLVIDESRELLYGSDRVGGCIDIISMNTLEIVDTVSFGSLSQPTGLDISPDGNELAVALFGSSKIALIDLETREVSGSLEPIVTYGPNLPYDVVYGRPGRLYSVGNPGSSGLDNVHTFDTINKIEVEKSSAFIRSAPRLAITADNNTLYVSEVTSSPQNIYRFDISTDIPVQTARGPHGPVNVNTLAVKPDASRIYSSRGQVWTIYLTSQLGSFSPYGNEIEYSDTLQSFFITSGSAVYEFDANTYELVRLHKLSWTGGVARVNAAGTFLYVSTDIGIEARSLDFNCFVDNDEDGYGTSLLVSDNGDGLCNSSDNESNSDNDCNDSNLYINPGAEEVPADLIDQNCDGIEDCYEDSDLDFYGSTVILTGNDLDCSDPNESISSTDCNNGDGLINPGVAEIWYDGIDSNCDGANDYDADKDTYVGSSYNTQAGGTAPNTGDCDDEKWWVKPGFFEIWYDGLDSNCDGANDYDADKDTYVISSYNAQAGGTAPNTGDCDDSNDSVHPGALEILDDGIDQNCDGSDTVSCILDADQDGYGTTASTTVLASDGSCDTAQKESPTSDDCDDSDATFNPGVPEIWYDGIDINCDGANDYDADKDTYVGSSYNTQAGGTAPNTGDCDDGNGSVNPDALEIPVDGIDQNCDGSDTASCILDADQDGYGTTAGITVLASDGSCDTAQKESTTSDDCDDSDATVNPAIPEIWYDGIDSNCDGANDYDADRDTYVSSSYNTQAGGTAPNTGDCDDGNGSINPGALEICDKSDNNCDDQIDEDKVCRGSILQLVLPAILNHQAN